MIALYIVTGLLGLGIIVFIHELGHFMAAKLVGIEVEAFAIGWGPPIAAVRKGPTEYRLCAFPVGGYCKMKGESIIEKRIDGIPVEQEELDHSLFGVSPFKRIITYVAGPLANVIFAVIFFTCVWMIGSDYQSYSNRIIVLSDYPQVFSERTDYPSVTAGLKSGDIILSIDSKETHNYRDIQDNIARNPDTPLPLTFSRNGKEYDTVLVPELNKNSGTGFVGIAPWIQTKIGSPKTGTAAHLAGLQAGDIISELNGAPISNYADLLSLMHAAVRANTEIVLTVIRQNQTLKKQLSDVHENDSLESIGITFVSISYKDVQRNPFKALVLGVKDTIDVFVLSIRGIALLFKGIDLKETVSGPLRITYTVGQYAVLGFSEGFKTGIVTILKFISFISVALCFMNMLPLPAVDGGMILYNVVELIRRKPLSMKSFYRFQMAGIIVIAVLLFSSLFNDIRYFFF